MVRASDRLRRAEDACQVVSTAACPTCSGIIHYMQCPKCQSATRVLETRQGRHGTRRRRECRKCGHRFSTYELPLVALVALEANPAELGLPGDDEEEGEQ